MSFSASTCLSYTGTSILTNPISIYTLDGTLITAVTLNQITNCPLILTGIPDGTTTIKLKSANNYCCDIGLTCNDLCTTCDLAFDTYSTSLISRIVAGNLTGSCDNSITDYRINWFKEGNIVFTSGHGTEFTPYNFTHPLVGSTSPMQPAGTYTPVVDRVQINGLNYSQTGGTGFIQANLECFNSSTVEVAPFRCDNGTEPGDYTHRVNFSGASVGVTPLTLSSTFEISAATTNYFAWKFNGFSISDTLKITYYGLEYGYEPIILEYYQVGVNVTDTNFSLSLNPKTAKQINTFNYFSKVTCLTGLTRHTNDYLTLEVIPNPINPQTNWDFYFTCLNSFDCSICYDNYLNTPYKIDLSTLLSTTGTCPTTTISFNITGCSQTSINGSDLFKYTSTNLTNTYSNSFKNQYSISSDSSNIIPIQSSYWFTQTSCSRIAISPGGLPSNECETPGSGTITFNKDNSGIGGSGVINMTFSELSDFTAYYNSYLSSLTYSGTPLDNTNINYYRYFRLRIPTSTGSELCGDGTTFVQYDIHFSSIVTTGITSNYTLQFTMPTMTKNMSFTSCETGCDSNVDYIINNVNPMSTGSTNIHFYSGTTSSRAKNPINYLEYVQLSTYPNSATTFYSSYDVMDYLSQTIPYSGVSNTIIPSLSAITCDYSSVGSYIQATPTRNIYSRQMKLFDYKISLTDPGNLTSYIIEASPIINGTSDGLYAYTAATVVNNVVTYSNSTYTF